MDLVQEFTVNTTFFIGEGHLLPGLGVEYRVWRPA